MSRMRMWVWTMPFVLAALIASQAVAQGVDPKSEKELRELGQKIDKNSSSADSGRVTSKIVDQWKGTQFQFAAGGNPRQLTGDDVQKLRQRRLGNGEISILLALAAKQTTTNPTPFYQIVAMREGGMGLGKLAKELGYQSLGAVQKSVKATDKGVEQVAASGRSEKAENVSKVDKPEKPDKPAKPEKVDRIEKSGR